MLRQLWHRPLFWAGIVLLWAALLCWLSSRVLPPVGPVFDHSDKLKHLIYFTAGSFAAARFLLLHRPALAPLSLTLSVLAFAFLTGFADELHQSFTPGRQGNDPGDLLADTAGGLLGALLALRSRHLFPPAAPG